MSQLLIAATASKRIWKHAAGVVVGDEVGVALAITGLDVGEPAPLLGQRAQCLGEELVLLNANGELAALGLHHGARDTDPVASINLAGEVRKRVVAEVALAHEQLHLARSVAGGGEHELALIAQEQHAPRDPNHLIGRRTRFQLVVPLRAQRTERVRAIEPDRIRLHARARAARRPCRCVRARSSAADPVEREGAEVSGVGLGVGLAGFGVGHRFLSKMIRSP